MAPGPGSYDEHGRLVVGWTDYDALCVRLAEQVLASGWAFDQVLCLARGGLRVGDVLSRRLRKPLGVMFTSAYRDDGGTTRGALALGAAIASVAPLAGPRVLVVDDLVDSGATFAGLLPELQRRFPEWVELRTAVLWQKRSATVQPDYVAVRLDGDPWIVQPFEVHDR